MKTWKDNLEETKQHYLDWWNHKGLVLNMWEHFQNGVQPHADVPAPAPAKDLNQKWFDPEWRAQYLDWYVAHSCLKADILPVANTQLGPGSLAAILGGRLEGGEDTIWIHPDPDFKEDIVFNPDNQAWKLHKDLLRACKDKAQGHYYVGMPDLMEGLDILAALKGTDNVLIDLLTQGDVVEKQLQEINDIYFKVFDELYDIIREGDEMAFCYFSAWAPGKMSKFQCDISTMISEEDFRRFVQPYIRQQCQKIPYSLYHLDGVGAIRHLPALLEIDELKAIQWTPGVGEPQGGSPKWYTLYKQILAAGKSLMACWVTVDELRPLLDAIGIEGVHLEMDFHNEAEVEEAQKIVDEYRSKAAAAKAKAGAAPGGAAASCPCCSSAAQPAAPAKQPEPATPTAAVPAKRPFTDYMKERILILDGGFGTSLQAYGLQESDFRGQLFSHHSCDLKGCNDVLCLTRPALVAEVHRRFVEAGANIITTNTFNAQAVSLQGYSLQDRVRDINLAAAVIARSVADSLSRPEQPVYVFGSMGPTDKCIGLESIGKDELLQAYREQAEALICGGADALLIETIFDAENAKVALEACRAAMDKLQHRLPVCVSYTIKDPKGINMMGQHLMDYMKALPQDLVTCVGLNCSLGAESMTAFLREMAASLPFYISAYPNAGLPNKDGQYDQTPAMMRQAVAPLAQEHIVNILGGCCGTSYEHIRQIATLAKEVSVSWTQPHTPVTAPQTDSTHPSSNNNNNDKTTSSPMDNNMLYQAILTGKLPDAEKATQAAIEAGCSPQEIINGQMIAAMSEIGQRFQDGKAFVPQLLMAARAMKGAMQVLAPQMEGAAVESLGKAVIGTVKGDLHDIGKNLVASMLEGCGFEVVNIGIDVSADKFVEAVKENNADILVLSALLTTTMPYMKEVIDALEVAGLRQKVKVMVGGAPLSEEYAREIGADGYSDNANSAVALAKRLMGKN